MLRDGLYNLLGGVARPALTLLSIPLLLRILGLEQYGLWVLVGSVVGLAAIADAGLSVSTTVFVAAELAAGRRRELGSTLTVTVGSMLLLATIAALGLLVLGPWLVDLFPLVPEAQRAVFVAALRIGALLLWSRLVQQSLVGVLQALGRYDLVNGLKTLQAVLATVGVVAVAWMGGRLVAMMVWQAGCGALVLGLHARCCWRQLGGRLVPAWDARRFADVASYSGLTWASGLGPVMFSQLDRLVVGALLGPPTLALYATITSVAAQIIVFSALPAQPLLSQLAAVSSADALRLRRRLMGRASLANGVVAVGAGVLLFLTAPTVLHLAFGAASAPEAVAALRAAVVIYALFAPNAVGSYALLAVGALRPHLVVSLVSGSLALLCISLGAAHYGLLGAILGNAGYATSLLMVPLALRALHARALGRPSAPSRDTVGSGI